MQKIVVTGATSMIGAALIEEAVKNEIQVLAIVRENSSRLDRLPKSELITVISCDIEKLKQFPFLKDKYDTFYHFAWNYTDGNGRKDATLQAKNIITTLEAVELANRLGCKKFIGAGSQAEYGNVEGKISPATNTNPDVPYGISKLAAGKLAEKLCEQYGMDFVWGRIFSVYGKYDNEWTMIIYAIEQFLKGEPAQFSAATQTWNYLNEHDAGKVFYLLGNCEATHGIYCVAHPKSFPLRAYIEKIAEVFGSNSRCIFAKENPNVKMIELNADVKKLIDDIGFIPKVSFEEGIRETINYRKIQKFRGE